MIPLLDAHGFLPQGIHECTLEELTASFGNGDPIHRRSILCEKLGEFLAFVGSLNCFRSVYADGSFVSDKEEPSDVDVLLELPQGTPQVIAYLKQHGVFDQAKMKSRFEIHIFPMLPGGPNLLTWFQGVRPEVARIKGLRPNHRKGILRITI
jgi:hypothetical protein